MPPFSAVQSKPNNRRLHGRPHLFRWVQKSTLMPIVQAPVKYIRAFGSEGELVAQLNLGGYPRSTEPLYFRWDAGERYRFEITYDKGESAAITAEAPANNPRGSIEIAIPYGTVNPSSPPTPKRRYRPEATERQIVGLGRQRNGSDGIGAQRIGSARYVSGCALHTHSD